MTTNERGRQRRRIVGALGAAGVLGAIGAPGLARGQGGKVKVGFMLPYTGTYAALGRAIENGFKLYVGEQGGKLGGRELEYVTVDDESEPAKAADNVNKLIKRDNVDVIVGTVHSGVQMAIVKAARDNNTLLIIPNAGVDEATGPLCAPNIFRVSFSNSQPGLAMGLVAALKGYTTAATITWKYAAGEQSIGGFKETFEKGGGKVLKELYVPFPNVEFQALLTEIASLKPTCTYAFFAGGGAVKFVKDYAAAGLKEKVPLLGAGFLTDGTLDAQGAAADGLLTTLHYADNLTTPRNIAFRLAYAKAYSSKADVYAVQGYDSAQLLGIGLRAVGGDLGQRPLLIRAMAAAEIDSPRGRISLSPSHNVVQDFYLRKVENGENKSIGLAAKALADPGRGCSMG
ncbi:MAG TPA: ABC transporter substrate-binding protein [Casimicrobiaceae bacterium]|nr:ABC transporter substrate-binding protein [Casimicrobiaceae bacterium]